MIVYVCLWRNWLGELTYATSFIDRAKARTWFLKTVEENVHGDLQFINTAVREAEIEFDSYVPLQIDAESDVAIVKVIETED